METGVGTHQASPFASSLRATVGSGSAGLLAILTFSVPVNLVAEYAVYSLYGPDDFAGYVRVMSLAEALLTPLLAIISVRAASASRSGKQSSYASLVRSSLASWGHVFKARLVAAMLVGLGTLLLIVPGVVLAVRYAFVEVLSIEENLNGKQARKASAELSSGHARKILRLIVSVVLAAAVFAFLAGAPAGIWPQCDSFLTAAMGDAVFDVVVSTMYGGAWFIRSAIQAESQQGRPQPIG